MQKTIVLDANDVKKIIADHFQVSESAVIKSQYSYTVVGIRETGKDGDENSVLQMEDQMG